MQLQCLDSGAWAKLWRLVWRHYRLVISASNSARTMKILQRFWPWKRILDLERRLKESNEALVKLHAKHEASSKEHAASRDGLRKMARILEMRGFDRTITTIAFLLACFSVVGQPLQRQLFTTNPPPLLSSISGPFVSTNGSGVPVLTYNGGQLTNVGVSVNVNSNAVAVTNGQLVTISGVTDTNAVNGLLGNVTNGAINNLSNYVSALGSAITNGGINNLSNYVNALGSDITNGGINNLSNYVNALGAAITNGAINNLSNYVSTTSANATNEVTRQINSGTNIVYATNVLSAVLAWPGPSNAVTVNSGFSDWFYASSTPVSLTNCVGATAGYNFTMDLCISNSSAATFTNFCTIPNATYVGQNGNNLATNALTIASGKQGYWHIETRGVNRTNVFSTVEQ